jgi:hypothetical protein
MYDIIKLNKIEFEGSNVSTRPLYVRWDCIESFFVTDITHCHTGSLVQMRSGDKFTVEENPEKIVELINGAMKAEVAITRQ